MLGREKTPYIRGVLGKKDDSFQNVTPVGRGVTVTDKNRPSYSDELHESMNNQGFVKWVGSRILGTMACTHEAV